MSHQDIDQQKKGRLKDTPLSVSDLAPIAIGGTAADALHRTLDLAQHVERWGFKRYWLAEHHNMAGIASAATAVVIGYVAAGTFNIRVGSGGVMLPNHAPLVIAEQFGTLESLYPGRIDLGLGRAPGTNPPTVRALRRDIQSHGRDFPEMLGELLGFLASPGGNQVNSGVRAIPGEGLTIPIWLLGSSDFSAQLAGHLGLPFAFAGQFAAENTQLALYAYRQSFQASAVLSRPYAMLGVNVVAADTDEKARYLSTTSQQKFLQMVRGRIHTAQMAPPVDSMEKLYRDEREQLLVERRVQDSIVGSPATVRERLETLLHETQADELIIQSEIYDHVHRLRSYEIIASATQS